MNNHDPFERGLPASIDAERSVLGAILLDNICFYEADRLTYGDFAFESHRRLFARIAAMMAEGIVVDIVTLANELDRNKEVQAVGGISYLASLTEGLPRRLSISEYVRIVKEKSRLRKLINVCSNTLTAAADQGNDSAELLTEADTRILEISAECVDDAETLTQLTTRTFDKLLADRANNSDVIGLPSGLCDLDTTASGYVEGELTVIGARPGQGKTALLVQGLIECGKKEIPAHCFPLELTREAMLRRMWCAVADIPFARLRNPSMLHSEDVDKLREAAAVVARFKLIMEDDPNVSPAALVAKARVSKRRNGTRFVGVDYLQKMNFGRVESRAVGVTDAAVQLANLAKNENLAVAVLSSLTEKTGRLRNAPPTLADLRLSGDIQYEASTVILIHREVDEATERIQPDGLFIIAKQRNGVTGRFPVAYTTRLQFETPRKSPGPAADQYQFGDDNGGPQWIA